MRSGVFVRPTHSRAWVFLVQIVSGILKTMGGTTCAGMSICRAPVCHRLGGEKKRGRESLLIVSYASGTPHPH
jgi:hypothetical protein